MVILRPSKTNKNSQEDNQHGDKEKENVVPEIIDNVEALEAKMKAMREAQKKFATYTQEQVDKIFLKQQWQQIRCVSHLLRWQ